MRAGEHYRNCISIESVTKADSQGLEGACLWIRLGALVSSYFGAKPSSEELCIHLPTSSWTLFCLLFLLLLTKPTTSRETLSTFPLRLAPTCLSFVWSPSWKASLQLVFLLIGSEAKRISHPAEAFFCLSLNSLQSISMAINLSHRLYIFAIILSFIFTAAVVLPPFHLQPCFIWSSSPIWFWSHGHRFG